MTRKRRTTKKNGGRGRRGKLKRGRECNSGTLLSRNRSNTHRIQKSGRPKPDSLVAEESSTDDEEDEDESEEDALEK
jgi:hypothetical protein